MSITFSKLLFIIYLMLFLSRWPLQRRLSADHLPGLQQLSQPVRSRLPKTDPIPHLGPVPLGGGSWLQSHNRSAERSLGSGEGRPAENLHLLPRHGALRVRPEALGFPAEGHLRGEQQVLQGRVPVPGSGVRYAGGPARVHFANPADRRVGWRASLFPSRLDPAADFAGEVLRADQYDLVQLGCVHEDDSRDGVPELGGSDGETDRRAG